MRKDSFLLDGYTRWQSFGGALLWGRSYSLSASSVIWVELSTRKSNSLSPKINTNEYGGIFFSKYYRVNYGTVEHRKLN